MTSALRDCIKGKASSVRFLLKTGEQDAVLVPACGERRFGAAAGLGGQSFIPAAALIWVVGGFGCSVLVGDGCGFH